jgi:hypothetical protein
VTEHELQHWLARNRDQLAAAKVSAVLGRGPKLGPRRGATWISFQSEHALGRAVLSADGHCRLTAGDTADGSPRFDAEEEFSSAGRLDDALAALVACLT